MVGPRAKSKERAHNCKMKLLSSNSCPNFNFRGSITSGQKSQSSLSVSQNKAKEISSVQLKP